MFFTSQKTSASLLWWVVIFLLVQASESLRAQTPDSFNPGLNGPTLALAVQTDGSLLLGGNFSGSRNGLARYEVNQVLDNSFNPGLNNPLTTGAATFDLQPDGSILVGGAFTNLSNLPRQRLARLNLTGQTKLDFNLGANSNILAIATQPDGKVLVAGNFTNLAGQARSYLGRMNANGTLDETFAPALNGPVQTLWVQNDSMILIGGEFTSVDGVTRNYLARLDTVGNLDGGFDPNADGPVYCFALQGDDRILVGGNFSMLAGEPRLRLARLETNGSLDATFTPEAGGEVRSLALQADGKIFVAGSFTNFNSLTRSNLVRLETTGDLDGYIPNPNASVLSLGLQADGKLLAGGNFTSIGGIARSRFARLTNNITAVQSLVLAGDTLTWSRQGSCPEVYRAEFAYSTNGLDWVALPAPNRIASGWELSGQTIPANATLRARGLVRGGYHNNSTWWTEFSAGPVAISFAPQDQPAINAIAPRLTVTAAGDGPFYYRWYRSNALMFTSQFPFYNPPNSSVPGITQYEVVVSNTVSSIRSRPASIWIPGADALNGDFTVQVNTVLPQPDGSLVVGGASFLYRFNPNGTFDSTYTPAVNGTVMCLAAQGDKTVLAGTFISVAGATRNRLARVDAFGGVDANFNPNVNGAINALAQLADGRILIGGSFTTVGGVAHTNLALLNSDGVPDHNFNARANGIVHSLAVQPDGLILVGGAFTQINGINRQRLARLFSDGSLDMAFNPNAIGTAVYSLLVQPDGKILVAGNFTSLGGQFRSRIGRLHASGALDLGFNPTVNDDIVTMQLQMDGKIWIGGIFFNVGGQTRNCLARLNPDGTVDATIGQNSGSGSISGLALQRDGKLLAVGNFTSLYGSARSRLGRVINNSPTTESLTTDGSSITWLRDGSSAEIDRATFDYSTNGTDWVELPPAVRIANGWQSAGAFVPTEATLRARGYANGSLNTGTAYCIETSSGPPLITLSPTNLHPVGLTNERLTVNTYGTGPFTFQWYRNGVLLSNETNSWINAFGVVSVNTYEVVVTSPSGTIRSAPLPFWATGADSLNPNANGTVYAIALQPDQKILLGGTFTGVLGIRLARLLPSGAQDDKFITAVFNGSVYALAVQTNGQILVGGSFTNLNGQPRSGLARLNANGSLDNSFNPILSSLSSQLGSGVQCFAIQPDGKILIGGWFINVDGQSRYCLGRLNPDGSLDSGFVPPGGSPPGAEAGVMSIILDPSGDIFVFGEMREPGLVTTYAQRLDASGNRLYRIFYRLPGSPTSQRYVSCAARQADGSIIMGGWFDDSVVNSQLYRNIARMDANGFLDQNFTNYPNNPVTALAVQEDGKILVGGSFTSLGGSARNGLARLNTDGTVDSSFTLQASGTAWIHSLAIQPNGRYVVGGSFTNLNGSTRNNVGRLLGPELATETLTWNGTDVTWLRSAASPVVGPTTLETSSDGVNWSYQGDGVRTSEGWQWLGVTVPSGAVMRTRGFIGGGESFWHAESILPTSLPIAPQILTAPGSMNLSATGFSFLVNGNLGHLAVIEASTNLTQWAAIQTNRLLPPPTFFNDSSATNLPRRFYRARLQ